MKIITPYIHKLLRFFTSQDEAMIKKQAGILIVSLILSSLLFLESQKDGHIQSGYILEREGIGGNEYNLPLQVEGINPEKKENVNIKVSPRIYTKEEADQVFSSLHEKAESLLLSEDESFDEIKTSLHLTNYFPEENVKMSWSFTPTALINGDKKITEDDNLELILNYRSILGDKGKIYHELLEQDQILEGILEIKFSTNILSPKEEPDDAELENYFRTSEDYLYSSPTYFFPIRIYPEEKTSLESLRSLLKRR